jgi:hypothetical protein
MLWSPWKQPGARAKGFGTQQQRVIEQSGLVDIVNDNDLNYHRKLEFRSPSEALPPILAG